MLLWQGFGVKVRAAWKGRLQPELAALHWRVDWRGDGGEQAGLGCYCWGTGCWVSLICWFWLAVTVMAVPPPPLRRIQS